MKYFKQLFGFTCEEWDEIVNHIINECRKLAQKETWLDWKGQVIYWELRKKFWFDYITKRYLHKPESVQENEMHKILWDFEIQTDQLNLARKLDLVLIDK